MTYTNGEGFNRLPETSRPRESALMSDLQPPTSNLLNISLEDKQRSADNNERRFTYFS